MSEPNAKLFKKLKTQSDDGSVSDEDTKQKSSLFHFPGIRETVTKGAKTVKQKVSRQRGRMVRIIKKRFPRMRDRVESHGADVGVLGAAEAYPPLYPQLRGSWQKVTAEYISKDIHRLIYRVSVKTSGIRNVLLEPPPKEDRGGTNHAAATVVSLVKLLAKRIETAERAEELSNICEEHLGKVDEKTDLIRFNMSLFDAIGADSKIMRVLRCIHQSLVLKPYGILKTQVIKDKLTKDIRSEDGWQVIITVAHEGFIQVVHVRKEQSIDMPTKNQPDKEKNHWEFEWEVSMTFDKNMEDMTQSRLSITNLVLSEHMDPDLDKQLREMMQDGNLIVF